VWISELDVRMNLPADATKTTQQASDYGRVVTACLAVARCVGITVWGFTDFDSWVPGTFAGQGSADIFDTNLDPKPAVYGAVTTALGGTPPSPSPSPSNTPSPSPSPVSGAPCRVVYSIQNQWNVGFTASLNITNLAATATNGWTLGFDFAAGQTVTQGWSGTWTQSSSHVSVSSLSWNSAIAPNATINIGFNGAHNGTNPLPASFTLNGATCTTS
jgi:endo-1,4-beta-xylanase